MAVYEYEHQQKACELGEIFEVEQEMREPALERCPQCGGPLRRLISRVYVSTPKGNSDYKNMGFTKLVRRDSGVYENVTATEGESRYVYEDKPETLPKLKKKVGD